MSDTIVGSPDDRRKREFRAALALEGITAREWAKQHGLWDTHLSRMVSGAYREDYAKPTPRIERVLAQVEQFTDDVLSRFAYQRVFGQQHAA